MNLFDAAELRMSVRSFCQEELNKEVLMEIDEFTSNIEKFSSEIDVNIEIIKTLGKRFRPPYYAVLYSENKPGCYFNAGYMMQQLVLYLTSRGIGSCYKMLPVGIHSKDSLGRKYMTCIAFGIPKDDLYRNPAKADRNDLERLCVVKTEITKDMMKLLEVARLAPSSFNNQPWRFVISEGKIHVFKREPGNATVNNITDVDMGIMMANVITCAEELWIDISIKSIQDIKEKKYSHNEYVTSIKME